MYKELRRVRGMVKLAGLERESNVYNKFPTNESRGKYRSDIHEDFLINFPPLMGNVNNQFPAM